MSINKSYHNRLDRRSLSIALLDGAIFDLCVQPFAILLPAYNQLELQKAEQMMKHLIELGCIQFCCIGPLAEEMHDRMDYAIEDLEQFSVVTTGFQNSVEGCEHFMLACGTATNLLSLTLNYPNITTTLLNMSGGWVLDSKE